MEGTHEPTAGAARPEERRDPRGNVRRTMEEVGDAARGAAREAREAGKEAAAGTGERQKERAGARLQSVARALHEAGQTLREDRRTQLGDYTEQAAQQVERLAGYLDRRDLDGLIRDARSMARRRPELFLGGCYFTGLLVGRFLKSSEPEPHFEERPPERPLRRPVGEPLSPEPELSPRATIPSQPPAGGGRP